MVLFETMRGGCGNQMNVDPRQRSCASEAGQDIAFRDTRYLRGLKVCGCAH